VLLALTGSRLAYPQGYRRERDQESQQREAGICTPPPDALDQGVSKLRYDGATKPYPRHCNAESEPAPSIEPSRDRLCIAEGCLDGARHLGNRED